MHVQQTFVFAHLNIAYSFLLDFLISRRDILVLEFVNLMVEYGCVDNDIILML